MNDERRFTRRDALKAGAAIAGAGALEASNLAAFARAWAQASRWKPKRRQNCSCCAGSASCSRRKTASWHWSPPSPRRPESVTVLNESLDDVQPKASVAANTGQGPDIFWGLYSLPHLFPSKCLVRHRRRRLPRQEVRRLGAECGDLRQVGTVKALEYAKEMSTHFVPGCAAWNDSFNNKAFLESQISLTNNGVSIYAAAKANAAKDPKAKEVMDDMNHSLWPVGPVGKPTEFHVAYPMLGMRYTKFPQATKAFMAFTLEAENYNPWLEAAVAYITHPLNAYDANPVWTSDPKLSVVRDFAKRTLTAGGLGSVGEKAASALADFVILDMFASVCTDRASIKDAIAVAERQARRIYR